MSIPTRQILIIRFGALGDLCLLGDAIARYRSAPRSAGCRITLATKAAFAPLMATARGVDEVLVLENSGAASLKRLADAIQTRRWDIVIDAHHTLRSTLLLGLIGRRPDARLAKDTAARLAFMKFGTPSRRLLRGLSDRYDDLLWDLDPLPAAADPTPADSAPAFATANSAPDDAPVLGIAPGAQWASKQWPQENFAELLAGFRRRSAAAVRIFLGPREETWFAGSALEAAAGREPDVEIVRDLPLTDIAREIAVCSLLVTNDSGLLHLAEAAGVPVAAFFGPTVREFGYFPRLPGSRALEVPLSCRPCSRNGKRPCHRGDLACLREISVERALATVLDARQWPEAADDEARMRS